MMNSKYSSMPPSEATLNALICSQRDTPTTVPLACMTEHPCCFYIECDRGPGPRFTTRPLPSEDHAATARRTPAAPRRRARFSDRNPSAAADHNDRGSGPGSGRSEEHTSELQSREKLACPSSTDWRG